MAAVPLATEWSLPVEQLTHLLLSNTSDPMMRVLGALGPAIVLCLYVLGALAVYFATGKHKSFHDQELENRKTGLSTAGVRNFFAWVMSPWVRLLLRAELPPNAITTVSLGFSLAAGVAMAAGRFSLGGWLYFAAGSCDFFDGRIARARNIASQTGAALDSIVDRYCEAAILVGLAWYYRTTWVLFPVLLALTGSLLVPYVRAKAEALQVKMAEVGWLQRPERIVILGSSVALSPLLEVVLDPHNAHPMHWLAVVGISILAVGTQLTAAQRTRHLLALLAGPHASGANEPPRSPRVLVSSALATAADAALVASLASLVVWMPLPAATALGCMLGAVINFSMNRHWAFDASSGSMSQQALRYGFVSLSSALLNAGGVAVVALLPAVPSMVAWLLVRGTVFVVWTMPLFRDYVFSPHEAEGEERDSVTSLGE